MIANDNRKTIYPSLYKKKKRKNPPRDRNSNATKIGKYEVTSNFEKEKEEEEFLENRKGNRHKSSKKIKKKIKESAAGQDPDSYRRNQEPRKRERRIKKSERKEEGEL